MRKLIIAIILAIIIVFSILSLIFINYKSDVEAINNINVKLDDIDILDINFNSFELILKIEILNPSNKKINQLSSNFDIFIENKYIGKGNFSKVNIEANSNISKDVIITIYYSGLAEATVDIIKKLINNGEFSLNIKGTINAKAFFGMSIIKQKFNVTKKYP